MERRPAVGANALAQVGIWLGSDHSPDRRFADAVSDANLAAATTRVANELHLVNADTLREAYTGAAELFMDPAA